MVHARPLCDQYMVHARPLCDQVYMVQVCRINSKHSKVIVFTRSHTDDDDAYNDGTKNNMSPPGGGGGDSCHCFQSLSPTVKK